MAATRLARGAATGQAPAHGQAAAQQDHCGRRPQGAGVRRAVRPITPGAASSCRTTTPSFCAARSVVKVFLGAFDDYWANDSVAGFGKTGRRTGTTWTERHRRADRLFSALEEERGAGTSRRRHRKTRQSSLFFSLAFLYQTPGAIQNAIKKIKKDDNDFLLRHFRSPVKGIETAGVDLAEAGRQGDAGATRQR